MFVQVALPSPLDQLLDYTVPEIIDTRSLIPGIRVSVTVRNRSHVGVVIKKMGQSPWPIEKIKPLLSLIDSEPILSRPLMTLCEWASQYYHCPLGEVIFQALPAKLREGKPALIKNKSIGQAPGILSPPLVLNPEQTQAVEAIVQSLQRFHCFLLNGITGSGKTEVYLHVLEHILKQNQQALILVPEIALTPQTVQRFQQRFSVPVACFHSGLNAQERLNAWLQAREGEAKIIIGTRSAIFTPCPRLGIIIIDEEHDLSFKQQEGFRYSARDLAIMRARQENIPIVMGSATPSLESLHNAHLGRFQLMSLPERAGLSIHPTFRLIDIRGQTLEHGLSKPLLQAITTHLEQKNQVLLFLNRRGYAPTLRCHNCGWIAKCPRCDVHFTLHRDPPHLHCHHCDTQKVIDSACPSCSNRSLQNIGIGTERLEQALRDLFPSIPLLRIDRDTTRRKNALHQLLHEIEQGQKQILIGTQMIAKGHHFPQVTLVGIINPDDGFFSSDFRTTERMGQLLMQVAGRAGREEKMGEVLIQTHYPNHPLIVSLIQQGYNYFAHNLLQDRKMSQLPPFSHFALLRAEALKQELPHQFLTMIKTRARALPFNTVSVLGPIPSAMPKRKSRYRAQLLLQSSKRQDLHALLQALLPDIHQDKLSTKVNWSVDIDPMEMA